MGRPGCSSSAWSAGAPAAAALYRPNTCRQLAEIERLHQVVVGSRVEPHHSLRDRILGRDDHDRHTVPSAPQAAEHLQAPLARQAKVEEDDVVRFSCQRELSRCSISGPVHGVARLMEPASDSLAEHRIVFDQQDAHRLKITALPEELATPNPRRRPRDHGAGRGDRAVATAPNEDGRLKPALSYAP